MSKRFLSFLLGLCVATIAAATSSSPKQTSVSKSLPPHAAIATASPEATDAGMKIIQEGGNAFDAAVGIIAALAVAEPYNSGLGGGGFLLIYRAKGHHYSFIDARETAPLSAKPNMFLDQNNNPIAGASLNGPLSAAIPGTVAGMVYLAKHYGKLPLSKSLQPAIQLAEKGFLVNEAYQKAAQQRLAALLASPAAAKQFLHDSLVPAVGYRIKQPDLAKVLKAIVKKGSKAFYHGKIAKQLVKGVRQSGGIWQLKDLANYKIIIRKPLMGKYKFAKVVVAPPPSAGGVALITMLNIISGFDLLSENKVNQVHLMVEAMRRAFHDRTQYLGDPAYINVPTKKLISADHGNQHRQQMSKEQATPSKTFGVPAIPGGRDTTHFSVLDKAGNRVAATISLNYAFGSAFVPPGTGVVLNDHMDDFMVKRGVGNVYQLIGHEANVIAPGKRPVSSMSPTFLETKDKVAVLGTPGGSRIITMVLLAIIDFMDGNKPLSWVAIPRYHHQYIPDEITFEKDAFSPEQQQALKEKGHSLKQFDQRYGNMQAILWDKKNQKVYAASDPRGSGKAAVFD